MKTYRLTTAALALSGMIIGGMIMAGGLAIGSSPASALQPAASTPSPDHQANITSSSGGAPFDRHLYSPYSPATLTGLAGGGSTYFGGGYLIRGATQATLAGLFGGGYSGIGSGYLIR